jgi:ribonuclease HII
MGYATAEHLAGLDRQGASPHHRRSFSSVAQTVLALTARVEWPMAAADD